MSAPTAPEALRKFQKSFQSHIKAEKFEPNLEPWFLNLLEFDEDFSRETRLEIYSFSWMDGLNSRMREDYEALAAVIEPKLFDNIIKDYFAQYPSTSHTKTDVGNYFPEFIRDKTYPSKRPWHFDLANLERGYSKAFFTNDPVEWDLKGFAQSSPDEMENLKLGLQPSVFLIQSDWKIDDVWSKDTQEPDETKSLYLIYRHGIEVWLEPMSDEIFKILLALQETATLGQVIELNPVPATVETLLEWASKGIVRPILNSNLSEKTEPTKT